MKKIIYIVTAALFAFTVNAHNGATGVVKERMDEMSSMEKATKQLAKLVKDKQATDYASISELSKQIAQSNANVMHLFPQGSLTDASEAKARIWHNWEHFSSLMQESKAAAEGLAAAATSKASTEVMEQQFKVLTKTCKSCHRRYKVKK